MLHEVPQICSQSELALFIQIALLLFAHLLSKETKYAVVVPDIKVDRALWTHLPSTI